MSSKLPPLGMIPLMPAVARMWLLYRQGRHREMISLFRRSLKTPKQKHAAFARYTPTAHDVMICTYSKSGTYWTMQMALQIAHYGEAEFEHVHDVIAWPDVPMPTATTLEDTAPQQASPTGLRVIKTHLESEYVPYNAAAKVIVVVRDPKEVFVSSFHFAHALSLFGPMNFTVDDWMEMFLANEFPYESWAEHTAGYWAWHTRENVLFLNFDDMKKDHRGTVNRIAQFMGVALDEAQVQKVVDKSDFRYMKAIDEKFAPVIPFMVRNQDEPIMMRRGQAGASSELITPDQQAAIDRFCQAELRRLHSDFPYAEMFTTAAAVHQSEQAAEAVAVPE
jgi:hypothetical protein